ncbi:MAG: response regulator [Mojavia pulchra JT2-VF2]|jgi:YesN/AraC family two-component response regulator|uniref:Response regulator n=1 Tax=Mojavia pulchra JT2-VF2 TaxID=287848 RepID=A0A951PZ40_9NOST|nr:response regulator [Mojavia pulchra JT2-VF2]
MTKILVIEDEAESRDIFLDSLEAEGFEAIAAQNGLVGIQQAQEHLPDLVLCDIIMPELDGYSVLTTLRQNSVTATIPFIFLSAKSTKTEVRQGMNLGADDYLTKPSTVEELLEAIAAQLEKRATQKQLYTVESQQVPKPKSAKTAKSLNPQSLLPSDPHFREVFQFIEANYHQPVGLTDVAQAVGYSAAYLTDLVRRQTGQTVHQWIAKRRMAAACSLLLETNQSIEQIAEAVGYRYAGCFFRQFRISFGMTPQVWRKAQRIQSSAS